MGACRQIEIYPIIEDANLDGFYDFVQKTIGLFPDGNGQSASFLSSIQLIEEKEFNHTYFQFDSATFTLKVDEVENLLVWNIGLVHNSSQPFPYGLLFWIPEEKLVGYDDTKDSFFFYKEVLLSIFKWMIQLSKLSKGSLILFTDEASEGVFIDVLQGKKNSINYLFDLACIPNYLIWEAETSNYTCISKS